MANYSDPFSQFHSNYETAPPEISIERHIFTDAPVIQLTDKPSESLWALPALYKYGQRGEIRFYQVGYDGNGNTVSVHGQVGGVITANPKAVELNTRSQSLAHQALVLAARTYRDKVRVDNYRPQGCQKPLTRNAMLGEKIIKAYTASCKLDFPVAVEVKLDGQRGLFEFNDEGNVCSRTRGNKYNFNVDHILEHIKTFLLYFPAGTILDGEIYRFGWKRPYISGILRSKNHQLPESQQLIAYLFDIIHPDNLVYEARKDIIQKTFQLYLSDNDLIPEQVPIEIVPYQEASSWEEVDKFYDWAIASGYEGAVVKRMYKSATTQQAVKYSLYHSGRSHRFYKIKPEEDEEGIIVDVLDSAGRETGCARYHLLDIRGNLFTCRPEGQFEQRRLDLENRDQLIGQLYTYRMVGLTPYGVPDHPVGIGTRYDLDTSTIFTERMSSYAKNKQCFCTYFYSECYCEYYRSL